MRTCVVDAFYLVLFSYFFFGKAIIARYNVLNGCAPIGFVANHRQGWRAKRNERKKEKSLSKNYRTSGKLSDKYMQNEWQTKKAFTARRWMWTCANYRCKATGMNMSHISEPERAAHVLWQRFARTQRSQASHRKHFRSRLDSVDCAKHPAPVFFCYSVQFIYRVHDTCVNRWICIYKNTIAMNLLSNTKHRARTKMGAELSHSSYKQDVIGAISYSDNGPRIWMIVRLRKRVCLFICFANVSACDSSDNYDIGWSDHYCYPCHFPVLCAKLCFLFFFVLFLY